MKLNFLKSLSTPEHTARKRWFIITAAATLLLCVTGFIFLSQQLIHLYWLFHEKQTLHEYLHTHQKAQHKIQCATTQEQELAKLCHYTTTVSQQDQELQTLVVFFTKKQPTLALDHALFSPENTQIMVRAPDIATLMNQLHAMQQTPRGRTLVLSSIEYGAEGQVSAMLKSITKT